MEADIPTPAQDSARRVLDEVASTDIHPQPSSTSDTTTSGATSRASVEGDSSLLTTREAPSANADFIGRPPAQAPPETARFPPEASTAAPGAHTSTSKRRYHNLRNYWEHFLVDTWWPELISLAFSSCCLSAIAAILFHFDHGDIPQFSSGLSLNAIIATLAVGAKASLLFTVAATMSQLKWHWFHTNARRLQDIQTLDDAARGPLGAILLLSNRTALSISSIGAIIMIAALAFDPFIQQVVNYPLQDRQETTATTRLSHALEGSDEGSSTRGNVFAGIYTSSSLYERTPDCPSNNCTWPVFESAGWCSKCEDISGVVTLEDCDFSLQDILDRAENTTRTCLLKPPFGNPLPMEFTAMFGIINNPMNGTSVPVMNIQYTPIWLLSNTSDDNITDYVSGINTFVGETNPLLALGYASLDERSKGTAPFADSVRVQECVLTPCARTYNLSVTSGTVTADFTEDFGVLYTQESIGDGMDGENSVCWRHRDTDPTDIVLMNPTYNSSMQYVAGHPSLYITNAPTWDPKRGAWCTSYGGLDNWPAEIMSPLNGSFNFYLQVYPEDIAMAMIKTDLDAPNDIYRMGGIAGVMPGIASSLTYGALHHTSTGSADVIVTILNGTSHTFVPIVVVRWPWLSLSVLLNILALLLLAWTFHVTRKMSLPIWKSSALAMIYHGVEDDVIDRSQSYGRASHMHEAARTTYVRLGHASEQKRSCLLIGSKEDEYDGDEAFRTPLRPTLLSRLRTRIALALTGKISKQKRRTKEEA